MRFRVRIDTGTPSPGEVIEAPKRTIPKCSICGYLFSDRTRSSFDGAPVHNGCFERVGGVHRSRSSAGRELRRMVPPGESTKKWLRERGVMKVKRQWFVFKNSPLREGAAA